MKYMDIWSKPQQRAPREKAETYRLPPRIKDWPDDARADFKRVKNELWKWAKAKQGRDRTGLALIAYEAVRGEYDTKEPKRVVVYDNEEDMWNDLKKSVRR